MKKTISIFLFLLVIGFISIETKAQNAVTRNSIINSEFWLKIPVPSFSECKIMISDEGIYLPKEYCSYIYETDNLRPVSNGTKVKILSFKKKQNWVELKFKENGKSDFVKMYLKNSSKESLSKLFDIVFSKTEVEDIDDSDCEKGISKSKLLKCWGFPSSITKSGKVETYEYGLEFGNAIYGFDMATIVVKENIVLSIWGIM